MWFGVGGALTWVFSLSPFAHAFGTRFDPLSVAPSFLFSIRLWHRFSSCRDVFLLLSPTWTVFLRVRFYGFISVWFLGAFVFPFSRRVAFRPLLSDAHPVARVDGCDAHSAVVRLLRIAQPTRDASR